MAKRVSVDRWMFTVTTILVFIGLVMIFSASAVMAKERFGSAYEFLLKQLAWAVVGLAVMVVAMKVDYKRLQHPGDRLHPARLHHAFSHLRFFSWTARTARTAGSTSARFHSSPPS